MKHNSIPNLTDLQLSFVYMFIGKLVDVENIVKFAKTLNKDRNSNTCITMPNPNLNNGSIISGVRKDKWIKN